MRIRFLVFTLSLLLLIPPVQAAQMQAVSPSELQEAIKNSAQNQQKNRKDVEAFFSSEPARKALKAGKIDYQRVQTAVATLSPDELARLAARANQLHDFAGGALNSQQTTYAIIALATAVLVLVIVAAH